MTDGNHGAGAIKVRHIAVAADQVRPAARGPATPERTGVAAKRPTHLLGVSNMTIQSGWKWCRKCEALFYSGGSSQGVCPADVGPHDAGDSSSFVLDVGESGTGQHFWRRCATCQALYFGGGESQGSCPAGGTHGRDDVTDYVLNQESTGSSEQSGWRCCSKCQGLFQGGGSGGTCPAGEQHDAEGSGEYLLQVTGSEVLSDGR